MVQRREGRQLVIQALYAKEMSANDNEQILTSLIEPKFDSSKKNYPFVKRLFLKTLEQQTEIDRIIQDHINNWKMERLAILDKVIMRSALCEFLYFEKIPTR